MQIYENANIFLYQNSGLLYWRLPYRNGNAPAGGALGAMSVQWR